MKKHPLHRAAVVLVDDVPGSRSQYYAAFDSLTAWTREPGYKDWGKVSGPLPVACVGFTLRLLATVGTTGAVSRTAPAFVEGPL